MIFFNFHRPRDHHNQTSNHPRTASLLKPPSKKEKVQFYFQELFEGLGQMRKYLILCILSIFATQAPNVIGMAKYNKNFNMGIPFSHVQLQVGCLIGGGICYLASVFIRMRSQIAKRLAVQFIVLLFANIFCFIYFTFHTYDFLIAASKISVPLTVLQAINISVSGLYLTRFLDLLNPFWFFRIIPPSAYFVGWLLGSYHYEGQPNAEVYINCIGGILTTCLIIWVSSSFRWKIFTKRVENETWNQIHKLILNKVPNPIAVLDISGELSYTNLDFDKVSGKNIEAFSHKIIALKLRNSINEGSSLANSSIIEMTDANHLFHQSNNEGLDKLLIKAREFLKQGKIKENDIFVFDGKYDHNTDALAPKYQEYYEITLSFMLECEKIILILRNTTDQTRLITLESNSLYKDKLLASVSHELRTPLNGNLSLIEVSLGHEAIPQDVKENYLIPAYRSGKLLLHLINDILDYSQIAAKKLRLNFEEFNLKKTIKGCFQLLELQARKKQIGLNIIFKGKIGNFTTDHDRLRQIILNLLSNALKFTFQGGITILVKALPRNCLKIKVRDTGIGIKPEHLNDLFKEFTRLDDPQHIGMNSRGVGLGLTVADKLAKMLGPSNNLLAGIKVKSRYGEGSCFSFIIQDHNYQDEPVRQNPLDFNYEDEDSENLQERSLPSISEIQKISSESFPFHFKSSSIKSPFQQLLAEETQRPFIPVSQELITKKRLLIVDDEPFNILALESLLKGYNFIIETAFNGKEAIEKISSRASENQGYDLIFMDCQMPVLNGFDATKALKAMMDKNKIPQIPIIGCTAFNSKEDINLCLEVGMVQVIKKPLSKAGVEQIIKTLIT